MFRTISYKNHYIQVSENLIQVQIMHKNGEFRLSPVNTIRGAKCIITKIVNKNLSWVV